MSETPNEHLSIPDAASSETRVAFRLHQIELLQWFKSEAPSLAEPYRAACILMSDRDFPARVHLICHIVRDIYAKLPEVLDGSYRLRSANEVNDAIEKLNEAWKPSTPESFHKPVSPRPGVDTATIVQVSSTAVRKVVELLAVRQAIKDQPKSATVLARALYQRFVESGLPPPDRLVKAFEKERRWFTARAHLVRDNEELPSDEGLDEHFESFEQTLHSIVASHFAVQKELDDILQQANQ
jgi:hypothetical protein